MVRILLVEDDTSVADALAALLHRHGFVVDIAHTGADAAVKIAHADRVPNLVLLDLGLPDIDGIALCAKLRATSNAPMIALTARTEEADKVLALRMGADDYVVKPFSFQELLARIEAVLRRSQPTTGSPVPPPKKLRIDREAHRVWVHQNEVSLTKKEFGVLSLLMESPGHVVDRKRILTTVWGEGWELANRTLDVHISSLRSKLSTPDDDHEVIEVIRGVGYRLHES